MLNSYIAGVALIRNEHVAKNLNTKESKGEAMGRTTFLKVGMKAPDFTMADAAGGQFALSDYRGKSSVVLVFLRYAGCPICQLALHDLKEAYDEFKARGAEVAAFVQSPQETINKSGDLSVFPFRLIPDPNETIYKLYGVASGSFVDMLHPQTVLRGIQAVAHGHKQGKMEGNQWQLPGDFIVDKDGVLKLARVGANLGDNLPPLQLLSYL
jgi:thioredoxin-dependent peroxiredoxin